MDWGLFDRNAGENTFLREEIVYPQKVLDLSRHRGGRGGGGPSLKLVMLEEVTLDDEDQVILQPWNHSVQFSFYLRSVFGTNKNFSQDSELKKKRFSALAGLA